MAIDPNRVEAAASALAAFDGAMWDSLPDRSQSVGRPYGREMYRTRAAMLLERAFPELSSDPPTGWVAEQPSLNEIGDAVVRDFPGHSWSVWSVGPDDGFKRQRPVARIWGDDDGQEWMSRGDTPAEALKAAYDLALAARDAHLKDST